MKKTIYFFGLLLMAGAMVFSSCKKDEEEEPVVDLTPVLTFIGGAGYTSDDASLAPGSTFKVGINASENATSKKNLASFKVVRIFNNVPTTVFEKINISATTYTWEDDLVANVAAGEERWTFTITDKDGLIKELSLIITTTPTVATYKNLTMGSFNDPTYGSFMASATGTVLSKANATAAQGTVDFAFYLGAVNKSTFGAPANADVKAVFNLTGVWTVFNATLFELSSLSAADFDAIGDSYIFPAFTGTEDDINNLVAGDVVYFKTVNDKYGYIKVNSINGKGDIINIDMKVME
jgi:hypothetical protein